jgi:hypothetical protein
MAVLSMIALLLAPCCSVSVSVRTQLNAPIASATVRIGNTVVQTAEDGSAIFTLPAAGRYTVEGSAPGFQALRKQFEAVPGTNLQIELLLPPAVVESVTVEGKIPSDGSSGTIAPITAEQVKRLPTDPPTLRDALPLVPGVLRTPEGRLTISGTPEYRSTLLVNSLDVTDPGTGNFGATVPMDAVGSLNVFKSPYLAEYGRFTAAVVVVDTKKGGDEWHAEVNDPTPELRIRSRRIRGVRGFTPRVRFSGPLIKQRLYLSQSGEYRLNKTPVFTLPFPHNESWRERWNSLTQLDYIPSPSHSLTLTVHMVPQKVKYANLSFYTPRPASANLRGREFHAGVTDRLALGGGVLESAISANEVTGRTWAQGDEDMILTPATNLGNYFAAQDRRARRYQWLEAYTVPKGLHTWRFGTGLIHSTLDGWFRARPVSIAGFDASPLRRIDYRNRPGYALRDWENGTYVQDHWQIRPALALHAGVRADWQRLTATARIAPRLGLSWALFGDSSTIFRSGFGWFYDRAPLSVAAFRSYPEQVIDGVVFTNHLGLRDGGGLLVFGASREGNFAPRSRTWSAQLEHRFPRIARLRAGYLDSRSEGLVVLRPEPGQLIMAADGRSRYRQFEVVSEVSYRPGQQIFLSYVRSFSRGNLNEFTEWVGDFASPLVRPAVYATAPANMPHRFLLWGIIPFNPVTRLAPVIEYRTGLPYSPLDVSQQYAGEPNSRRFPNFFSLDFRVARDIHIKKHAVQLSFSMFNVTNHWNPDSVRWNAADPQFGEFLGQHRRRFRLDFDYLF